jgi:hypothetical protein
MSPTNFRPSHWRLPEEPHQIQRGQGEFVDLFGRVWLFQLLPRRDLVESNWPNLISYNLIWLNDTFICRFYIRVSCPVSSGLISSMF